ncbi:protein involved in gliding motility GldH [Apibacter mensalis]|uniref:Protein involved in gliding motility GldH n=2 Tax=Apibacter mensalis TaxID=1586267 RepID=A0A0X8XXI0_9FLAO|nr:protein involved in gliding motility GldH [Apibacter mensalis]
MKSISNTWSKKDTLNFNFKIENTSVKKNINFVVRNNEDYQFSNLYLFIKLKQGKKVISTDTLNYKLADKTGKWLGSGVGSIKEIYFQYKRNFLFSKTGDYTLSIVQGMRKDTLKGIIDFGVNIE